MTKILVLRLQVPIGGSINNMACFYDSLNEELIKNGNEVLWLNTYQEALIRYDDTKSFNSWAEHWRDKIKNFNPDIIFTFNNRIFEEIINITNCPIVLFEADLAEMFVRTELIKKYKERYYMATFFPKFIPLYKEMGFDDDRILRLHPATSIKRENKEKVCNIAFIGSAFSQMDKEIKEIIEEYPNQAFYKMMVEYWNSENYDYKALCEKYMPGNKIKTFDHFRIFDSRCYILQSLLDLNLKLYGVGWDKIISPQLLHLSSAFDSTPVYSLKHNQDVYNSSKINISISHPQCRGYSFPWRIYDIMASDGALVSTYSSSLVDYTKGHVDIPMYKSPFDARELCKKLLKEENLRQDLIEASNKFIEKYGRWTDNLEQIQNASKIKIIDNKDCIGSSTHIDYDVIKFIGRTNRAMCKSVIYGLLYSYSNLPIIYNLLKTTGRRKIYKSMMKYNNELKEECNG